MANDYDNLPTSIKTLKLIAGFLPPFATWYLAGNIWYAIAVYIIGFAVGHLVSSKYTKYALRSARRDAEGHIYPEDLNAALSKSLPVFLWAGPVCGAIAALAFVWFSKAH